MRIDGERLANGGRLEWGGDDARRGGEDALRVVVGGGRGCVLQGTAAAATVLVPLRGRLQLADGEHTRTLTPGALLVVEAGQRLQVIGRGAALWLAVFAPAAHWHRLVGTDGLSLGEPPLLPATHEADRALRRSAVRLARLALAGDDRDGSRMLGAAAFATSVADLQARFDPLIARCPGRTLAQRRSVFLRLQRVRNLMESSCHLDLDIAGFARMASYSPCHFIRAFSTVYGETPHAVLVEQRLGRAHRLIHDSTLAITEVARASGFENRCAFARSFKRRFGVTASDLREARRAAA
jgi:AraC family transcriptional regulator